MLKYSVSNKRGLELLGSWVETSLLIFIALGLIMGFSVKDMVLSYIVVFMCGLIVGSIMYCNKKDRSLFLHTFLSAGFIIGYAITNRTANIMIVAAIFISANILSYQVFKRKLIKLI